mmetsp:Transcript_17174/g.35340  ORF Transcript_17174/g.35340 Transcript_17174/m.35340 type:complete len:86 (+) Transcript_17174:1046-1303(+)
MIMEFERNMDWKGLVQYADETKNEFNNVNWATMFSKLGRTMREAREIMNDKVFNSVRSNAKGQQRRGGASSNEQGAVVSANRALR